MRRPSTHENLRVPRFLFSSLDSGQLVVDVFSQIGLNGNRISDRGAAALSAAVSLNMNSQIMSLGLGSECVQLQQPTA